MDSAHSISEEELLSQLGADAQTGLSSAQTEAARAKFGANTWSIEQKATWLDILKRQVSNILILMLIASAGVAAWVGHAIDAVGILAAVVLSVIFGFLQEYKAEAALSALQKMTSPAARVIREGREQEIPSLELVPGDILLLTEGDLVPADARLLPGAQMRSDQSVLTGESVPIDKHHGTLAADAAMAERSNVIYAGTTIVHGSGRAAVFATGLSTQFGRIAESLASVESEQTPLQKSLGELGTRIGQAAILLCIIFFIVGVWQAQEPWDRLLLTAVTLAVAAIPEGLPTVLAITLALGVQRMAADKALVRKLQAVETLGSASVICTDKTGTLTENRMTLVRAHLAGVDYRLGGGPMDLSGQLSREDGQPISEDERGRVREAMRPAVLCNEAGVQKRENGTIGTRGDPTEVALLIGAAKMGLDFERLRADYVLDGQNPFDYTRKMMAQIRSEEKHHVVYVKGAPEKVLARCVSAMTEEGVVPLTPQMKKQIHAQVENYASDALRTLGLACRRLKRGEEKKPQEVENELVWMGLVGMLDPPRAEVREALRLCQKAGIRVIMLTGDAPTTAKVISGQLGLLPPQQSDDCLMSGEELEKMDDEQLAARLPTLRVLARATPAHKFRIITALQKSGEVVAVTGDGVNDAPSIKKADIGVAMGVGGTDVARGAADMVLTDNNFSTLVTAVDRGRSIFENIRSFVRFQFTTNVAALTLMFITPLAGLGLPLLPLQILWINIIMDGPPALALGLEPGRPDAMDRPPRRKDTPFVSKPFLLSIVSSGLLMFLLTFGLFAYYERSPDAAMAARAGTMAFTVFIMLQLVNAFNCRSSHLSAFYRPIANRWLLAAVLVSFFLQMAILYTPIGQSMFNTLPLVANDWAFIAAAGALMLVWEEAKKLVWMQKVEY